jgi:hypothetical protein
VAVDQQLVVVHLPCAVVFEHSTGFYVITRCNIATPDILSVLGFRSFIVAFYVDFVGVHFVPQTPYKVYH